MRAIAGSAVPDRTEGFASPWRSVDAIADALDGTVLSRDDLHEALRRRLPRELLPWCRGCQSNHARRGLLVMAALRGRLCLAGRAGRQPAFAGTDQWIAWRPPDPADAGADLVRRYLGGYGRRRPRTSLNGRARDGARALAVVARRRRAGRGADRLDAARVGARARRRDAARPQPAGGTRLLAAGDLLLLGRDREGLVADETVRRELWKAIGSAGLVLCAGTPVALWRARKQGRRLAVELDAFAPMALDDVQAEADRLAPHHACASARVEVA